MMNKWFEIVKWFVRQRAIVQFISVILTLGLIITFVTWLLISNYKERAKQDAEIIKSLRTQMEVREVVNEAKLRRQDSIHKLEMNNERLTTKTYVDHIVKDQEDMKKALMISIQELKRK